MPGWTAPATGILSQDEVTDPSSLMSRLWHTVIIGFDPRKILARLRGAAAAGIVQLIRIPVRRAKPEKLFPQTSAGCAPYAGCQPGRIKPPVLMAQEETVLCARTLWLLRC